MENKKLEEKIECIDYKKEKTKENLPTSRNIFRQVL